MKVLLLSRYTKLGASSRLRSYQYIPFLEQNGIEVVVEPLFDSSYVQQLYQGKKKDIRKILFYYFHRIRVLLLNSIHGPKKVRWKIFEVLMWG